LYVISAIRPAKGAIVIIAIIAKFLRCSSVTRRVCTGCVIINTVPIATTAMPPIPIAPNPGL
jgi:hypothetical protein